MGWIKVLVFLDQNNFSEEEEEEDKEDEEEEEEPVCCLLQIFQHKAYDSYAHISKPFKPEEKVDRGAA